MTFAAPYWLYGGLAGAVLLALVLWAFRAQANRNLKTFAQDRMLAPLLKRYSTGKRLWKDWLVVIAVAMFSIALARPQMGFTWEESSGKGIDIVIAMDVSKSMLAEDIKPSRLERAKLAVLDFIAQTRGDRIGLVAFAGNAFLQCPLTLDYDALRLTLNDFSPKLIPVGGSNIAEAIEEAAAALDADNNYKIVVLITDGEDLSQQGITKAEELAKEGVTIYTVGVGSEEGVLIPLEQPNGELDYVRDSEGNVVKSRLDVATLEAIARKTGGFYVPLGNTGEGLRYVYQEGLGDIPAQDREAKPVKKPIERFGWFLAAGILLLLVETCLSTRRREELASTASTAARVVVVTILGLLAIAPHQELKADAKKAAKLLEDGNYSAATKAYESIIEDNPEDARLYYNKGIAHYRGGEYNMAIASFESVLKSKDVKLQADALYNLGNTYYRRGQELPKASNELDKDESIPSDDTAPEPDDAPAPVIDLIAQAQTSADVAQRVRQTIEQYTPLIDASPTERQPAWEPCDAMAKELADTIKQSEGLPDLWKSALQDWETAIEYYDSSLVINEDQDDAQRNRKLVATRLAAYRMASKQLTDFLEDSQQLSKDLNELIKLLKRPSELVLEAEEKADRFVPLGMLVEAYQTLSETAEKDPTAIHYQEKLTRLQQLLQKLQELDQGGQQ